jgi:hypothetical protein
MTAAAVSAKSFSTATSREYAALMEAVGTTDFSFIGGLIRQLANACSQGREIDESGVNFMLSVIKGIKPRGELEAMQAAQMAAVHMAAMTMTRRFSEVETIQQQDCGERALNKLMRTHAMQLEALKRYRRPPGRWVTVPPPCSPSIE